MAIAPAIAWVLYRAHGVELKDSKKILGFPLKIVALDGFKSCRWRDELTTDGLQEDGDELLYEQGFGSLDRPPLDRRVRYKR